MPKEIGIITIISGTVVIKTPEGKFHEAKVGEVIHEGDIVMGTARVAMLDGSNLPINGEVKFTNDIIRNDTPTSQESAIQPETKDVIIDALNRGTDLNQTLDATAAGLGGSSDGGGGSTFVTLGRILESVTGQNYGFGFTGLGNLPITEGVGPIQIAHTDVITTVTTTTDTPTTPTDPQPPVVPPVEPPVTPPVTPPTDDGGDKEHKDNGKGNGIDDAPGNSGDHKGDDADGSNTPGTKDTSDPKHEVGEENHPKEENPTPPKEEDDTQGSSDEHKDGEHDSGSSGGSETDNDEKHHADNGKGNGVDDAPGNSGDTKGDDADGSNTPGTDDTDVIPMPVDQPKGNNGWGNGDQDAPGNSGPNNNAENNTNGKEDPSHGNNLNVKDVLSEDDEILVGGTDNTQHGNIDSGNSDHLPMVDNKDPISQVIGDLLKNNGHHDS